jgi:hypothetical protein
VLKTFSDNTQFIAVTRNKLKLEARNEIKGNRSGKR